ncbi:MAG: hypothetical protein OEL89_02160 [Candidatus Peregrinibacteria bacterium]|nr:hypothetical protein [Candidatus Peregrinibacteria bacterium]
MKNLFNQRGFLTLARREGKFINSFGAFGGDDEFFNLNKSAEELDEMGSALKELNFGVLNKMATNIEEVLKGSDFAFGSGSGKEFLLSLEDVEDSENDAKVLKVLKKAENGNYYSNYDEIPLDANFVKNLKENSELSKEVKDKILRAIGFNLKTTVEQEVGVNSIQDILGKEYSNENEALADFKRIGVGNIDEIHLTQNNKVKSIKAKNDENYLGGVENIDTNLNDSDNVFFIGFVNGEIDQLGINSKKIISVLPENLKFLGAPILKQENAVSKEGGVIKISGVDTRLTSLKVAIEDGKKAGDLQEGDKYWGGQIHGETVMEKETKVNSIQDILGKEYSKEKEALVDFKRIGVGNIGSVELDGEGEGNVRILHSEKGKVFSGVDKIYSGWSDSDQIKSVVFRGGEISYIKSSAKKISALPPNLENLTAPNITFENAIEKEGLGVLVASGYQDLKEGEKYWGGKIYSKEGGAAKAEEISTLFDGLFLPKLKKVGSDIVFKKDPVFKLEDGDFQYFSIKNNAYKTIKGIYTNFLTEDDTNASVSNKEIVKYLNDNKEDVKGKVRTDSLLAKGS